MIRNHSKPLVGAVGLALAVLVMATSMAAAVTIFERPGGATPSAKVEGQWRISGGWQNFTGGNISNYTTGVLVTPGVSTPIANLDDNRNYIALGGSGDNRAYCFAWNPPGADNAGARAWASGAAEVSAVTTKLPSFAAITPDTLDDSLRVLVNRGTPGQITLSINGFARHFNLAAASHRIMSRIDITVYPDEASADAGTGEVAFGKMTFGGNSVRYFRGFFSSADWTAITPIGNEGNDFQVATVPSLQKVVTGVNAATAVVKLTVDPDALDNAPASTPSSLALLAVVLFGGSAWFLMRRRQTNLA